MEGSRRVPVRLGMAALLVCSAALTAALAHLGYHYVRLGESFARLIVH